MRSISVLLPCFIYISQLQTSWGAPQSQKLQTTRTALHVARSLDPDKMESMAVRTREGDLTTIIVKKRFGKSSPTFIDNNGTSSDVSETILKPNSSSNTSDDNFILLSSSSDSSPSPFTFPKEIKTSDVTTTPTNSSFPPTITPWSALSQNRTQRSDIPVPAPVYIRSSMVYVKNDPSVTGTGRKLAKSLLKVDNDGIPVVTGVRVPDDESDKHQVWRNARVINGILVPYDKSNKNSSLVNLKHKPLYKPSTLRPHVEVSIPSNAWSKIASSPVTKKSTSLPNIPNAEPFWNENKWELHKKVLSPSPTNPGTFQSVVTEAGTVLPTIDIPHTGDGTGSSRPVIASNLNRIPTYEQHPTGLWIASQPEENQEHKYVTDRILEYIRNINKDEMKRLTIQKFTARDAKMLSEEDGVEGKLDDVTESSQQPQIQARILHIQPSSDSFPNSEMYSPSTPTPARVSFAEGVRTPVLQYAHPEFGVQSARSPEPSFAASADLHPQGQGKRDFSSYYEDIHSDRGPFVFEPASPTDDSAELVADSSKRVTVTSPPSYYQRPMKTFSYFQDDKSYPSYPPPPGRPYYGKFAPPKENDYKFPSAKYPPHLYYEDVDGRPFWIRIGDSLKEQVQSGIDKMTDLTRPVVEPLVEASHKISHNLGLSSGNRGLTSIQEKLGSVPASSLILPAIGIVAGGAALGLGAVAVGR